MREPFPRWGVFCNYHLSTAACFLQELGWVLRAHVVVLGPLAFCVVWRKPTRAPCSTTVPGGAVND